MKTIDITAFFRKVEELSFKAVVYIRRLQADAEANALKLSNS